MAKTMNDMKKYLELAKEVKSEMTTSKAGCYRLSKLPRSATNKVVAQLIKALSCKKDNSDAWQEVYESKLYKKDSADYCCILSHICVAKKQQIERLRAFIGGQNA